MSLVKKDDVTWLTIKDWVETKLGEMRVENDDESLDERETSNVRGRIAFAKEILDLESDPEEPVEQQKYID